ncbi:hypothetical protein AruPA_14030 [Acidiphilium sp. PA]|uniref:hypothetical protein n=1 Tax=Acidiphilium sp. PA TaxID=2871705 RepID=UPI002244A779|nr:hypothetical protein [Acidiphilium sp. PA]MCW8308154.1 hypothetical protein [Acidiphilium sp. PA]
MRSAHGRTAIVKMAVPVDTGTGFFWKLLEFASTFQKNVCMRRWALTVGGAARRSPFTADEAATDGAGQTATSVLFFEVCE